MSTEFCEESDTTTYLECFESGIISKYDYFNMGIVSDDETNTENYLSERQDKSVLSAKQDFEVLREQNIETPLNMDFDIRDCEGGPHIINNEED